ncbi:MAG TPA: DUF4349 domain-containing protein [Gemmatimonadaceae bacterium]
MSATTRLALLFIVIAAAMTGCDADAGRRQYAHSPQAAKAAFSAGVVRIADSVSPAALDGFESRARHDTTGAAGAADRARVVVSEAEASPAPENTRTIAPPAVPQDVVPGSMLVRVGQASVQVESLDVGISRVRDVARRTGAVIANTTMEDGKEQTRAASLELRIPSQHFDEAVSGLSPIGKLESVNVNVEDVGEEFVDVQARMTNARRLEQRLTDLLANRTGKLTDVLRVESELARVREEIERFEGRMRYLSSRASVSTLTIALHEAYPIVAEHAGMHPMRDAFAQAGRNFVSLTAGLIASLGILVPVGLLIGAALYIARRFLANHGLRLPEKSVGGERA